MKKEWLQLSYEFSGLFYKRNSQNCRMVLDIREIGCDLENPDLIVIMMNPGSSKPILEKYHNQSLETACFVPTYPDDTQWKVIDFMRKYKFQYARILNLSDICEPNSGKLNKNNFEENSSFLNPIKSKTHDFMQYLNSDATLLLGWGAKDFSINAIVKAIQVISKNNYKQIFGNFNRDCFFYHPTYFKDSKKSEWLNGIKIVDLNKLLVMQKRQLK